MMTDKEELQKEGVDENMRPSAILRQLSRSFTVAVEGNIASGKTSFLEHFCGHPAIQTFPEPVKLWQNVRGHNTLDLVYKDASRWALTFQTYVQLTMVDIHTRKATKPVKLMERSIHSAKYCFVENLHKSGVMPDVEYTVLTEWFDWLIRNLNCNVDLIVYLRTQPEVVHQRLKDRCRSEEQTVPLSYLKALHELHESWLVRREFPLNCEVLTIDADQDLNILRSMYSQEVTERILNNLPEGEKRQAVTGVLKGIA